MQRRTQSKHAVAAAAALVLAALLQLPALAADSDDDTPPVLHAVEVGEPRVYPGGSVLVAADAADDDSGVRSISVQFRNAASGDTLTADLTPSSDEAARLPYSGQLKIPKNTADGVYQVVGVTLLDWNGNRARYLKSGGEALTEAMAASFTVAGAGAAAPPRPLACRAASDGADVSIHLTAAPGEIPVDKVTLLFENSANSRKLSFSLEEEDLRDGAYTKRFPLSPHEPSGTFSLLKITFKDAAGNKTTYTARDTDDDLPLPVSAAFPVRSAYSDTRAPVLHSIAAGQPVRREDETRVRLTVKAEDDLSGIDHITVKFKSLSTGDSAGKVLRQADTRDGGTYTGDLVLDSDDPAGTYLLDSITLVDRSGNRVTYLRPDDADDKKPPLPQTPAFELQRHGSDK